MILTNKLIELDSLHARIDLMRMPTHILTLLAALVWAAWGGGWQANIFLAFLASSSLLVMLRLSLGRMGVSRLSSFACSILVIALYWGAALTQAIGLTVLLIFILWTVEYLKKPTKLLAALGAIFAGTIAALMDERGLALLVVFLSILLARTVWYALIERISKKLFVLFVIKAVAATVISIGLFKLLDTYFSLDWLSGELVKLPHMSVLLVVPVAILCLWGWWATLLLKTKRSPSQRAPRLFLIHYSLAVIGVIALLRTLGDDIFSQELLRSMQKMGLTTYGMDVLFISAYTLLLFMTAGIDRSLYAESPKIRAFLANT